MLLIFSNWCGLVEAATHQNQEDVGLGSSFACLHGSASRREGAGGGYLMEMPSLMCIAPFFKQRLLRAWQQGQKAPGFHSKEKASRGTEGEPASPLWISGVRGCKDNCEKRNRWPVPSAMWLQVFKEHLYLEENSHHRYHPVPEGVSQIFPLISLALGSDALYTKSWAALIAPVKCEPKSPFLV